MMNFLHKHIVLAVALVTTTLSAQQQITRIDTIGGTEVQVTMDSRVQAALDNLEDNCTRANTARIGGGEKSPKPSTGSTGTEGSTGGRRVLVANRALTDAEICRQNPRILGIKIQLTVVKSNEEANEVKAYFRRRFPYIKVETDASLRPNYKILAGSYRSKQSAAGDLAKIRQYFKSAVPVQYRVFCVEAK